MTQKANISHGNMRRGRVSIFQAELREVLARSEKTEGAPLSDSKRDAANALSKIAGTKENHEGGNSLKTVAQNLIKLTSPEADERRSLREPLPRRPRAQRCDPYLSS